MATYPPSAPNLFALAFPSAKRISAKVGLQIQYKTKSQL